MIARTANFVTLFAFLAVVISLGTIVTLVVPFLSHGPFQDATIWFPQSSEFGLMPMIWGSIVCSSIGVGIALPLGLLVATGSIFFLPKRIGGLLLMPIEALAGVPSILFGMLGFMLISPQLVTFIKPVFSNANETSLFMGGVVLSWMLIPYATSYCRIGLAQITSEELNAADALGISRTYFVRTVVWPKCWKAFLAAGLQSWSRGMGEAIALSMIIGRADVTLNDSKVWSPGQTLATKLSSSELFLSWDTPVYRGAIMFLLLVLLLLTVGVSLLPNLLKSDSHTRTGSVWLTN